MSADKRAWVSEHLVQAQETLDTDEVSRPAQSFSPRQGVGHFGLEENAAKV